MILSVPFYIFFAVYWQSKIGRSLEKAEIGLVVLEQLKIKIKLFLVKWLLICIVFRRQGLQSVCGWHTPKQEK